MMPTKLTLMMMNTAFSYLASRDDMSIEDKNDLTVYDPYMGLGTT